MSEILLAIYLYSLESSFAFLYFLFIFLYKRSADCIAANMNLIQASYW